MLYDDTFKKMFIDSEDMNDSDINQYLYIDDEQFEDEFFEEDMDDSNEDDDSYEEYDSYKLTYDAHRRQSAMHRMDEDDEDSDCEDCGQDYDSNPSHSKKKLSCRSFYPDPKKYRCKSKCHEHDSDSWKCYYKPKRKCSCHDDKLIPCKCPQTLSPKTIDAQTNARIIRFTVTIKNLCPNKPFALVISAFVKRKCHKVTVGQTFDIVCRKGCECGTLRKTFEFVIAVPLCSDEPIFIKVFGNYVQACKIC